MKGDIQITVTPATRSGYRFEHMKQVAFTKQVTTLAGAQAEAIDRAVQQIRANGRDFKDYVYMVEFTEV